MVTDRRSGFWVVHKKRPTGVPGLSINFDVYNPRIETAIQQAVMVFCQQTLDTLIGDVKTGIAKLREELGQGLFNGENLQAINARLVRVFDFGITSAKTEKEKSRFMLIPREGRMRSGCTHRDSRIVCAAIPVLFERNMSCPI